MNKPLQRETAEPAGKRPPIRVRKWYSIVDETLSNESGIEADGQPLIRVVIGAVVNNPFARRFEQDLSSAIAFSMMLGEEFGSRLVSALPNGRAESYGKACIVGTSGEYEHGNAFLTTEFADPIRAALGGALSWIPSTGKVGTANAMIDVPLAHKDALYVRSHYDTISVCVGDAPYPDEIALFFACATRGRLHARLGGLKASEITKLDGLG